MKHSLILFLLIPFFVFSSCGGFLEPFETDEEYYSCNPHCTIFFLNQSNGTIYVRADCWLNDDNQMKWITEGWPKEIKAHSMDSLCVLATASNGKQPNWQDLKNNNHRDSLVVFVFDTFKKAVMYDVENKNAFPIRQYRFAVQNLGVGNTKSIIYDGEEND